MNGLCRKRRATTAEPGASDTDWYWTLRAMIDLLGAALRRDTDGIEFAHAPVVRALVLELHSLAQQIAEPEGSEDKSRCIRFTGPSRPHAAPLSNFASCR